MLAASALTGTARTLRVSQAALAAWRRDGVGLAATLIAAGVWFLGRGAPGADLMLGAAGLWLGFMAPAWLLVLWAFCLPFEYARELVGLGTVYTGELLLLTALPGAAWHWLRQPAWRGRALSACGWFWPLLLIAGLSAWHAHTPAAWKGLLRWGEFILAFLLAAAWLRGGREAERVLWALVWAGMLSACQGVAETAAGAGARPDLTRIWLYGGETVRASAGFGANTLAMYLALLLPWSAAAALSHPSGWGRFLGLAAAAMLSAGFIAAYSLTGWLALACAAGVLLAAACARQPRLGLWTAISGLLALAVILGFRPELLSGPFWETKLLSWQDRLDYVRVAGKMLAASPWLGIGPGMYRHLAPLWGTGSANPIGLLTHPHSLWLTALVEMGALGLAAIWAAAWRYAARVRESLRRLAPGWPRIAGWALAAGLAGFFAANFTEHGLVHDRGVHAALAAAVGLAWIRKPGQPGGIRIPPLPGLWRERPVNGSWRQALKERRQGRSVLYACLERAFEGRKGTVRVLELGSGPALDALQLAAGRRKLEVHALDASPRALAWARQAARSLRRPLRLHAADARRTGLPAESFDVVFSQGLLEHFRRPEDVWAETARLLKPGGYAVADVPQTFNPYTLAKLWHQWAGDWPWGREASFTLGALRSQAAGQGLAWVEAEGYGYRGGPLDAFDWLRRLLQPRWPAAWGWWERRTGAYWMMNLVAVFRKRIATDE